MLTKTNITAALNLNDVFVQDYSKIELFFKVEQFTEYAEETYTGGTDGYKKDYSDYYRPPQSLRHGFVSHRRIVRQSYKFVVTLILKGCYLGIEGIEADETGITCYRGGKWDAEITIAVASTDGKFQPKRAYSNRVNRIIYLWFYNPTGFADKMRSGYTVDFSTIPDGAEITALMPEHLRPFIETPVTITEPTAPPALPVPEAPIVTEVVETPIEEAEDRFNEYFEFHFGAEEQAPFPMLDFRSITEFDGELASDIQDFCKQYELQERETFNHKEFSRWQRLNNRLHWLNEEIGKDIEPEF